MPLWNWIRETRDMPKELGLFYVAFLTIKLYIQLDQLNIFHVTLPTISHQVSSNFILVFKILHLNLLNIMTLMTLKVVLVYHHTRLKTILTFSNQNCQGQPSQRKEYFWTNCLWNFKINWLSTYSSVFWSCIYYQKKTNGKKITHGRSPRKSLWIGRAMLYLSHDQGNYNSQSSNHWCLKNIPWVHASDEFCVLQFWKHPWIYLWFFGYMFCYLIPLWVSTQKQAYISWHPKMSCHYIEESG